MLVFTDFSKVTVLKSMFNGESANIFQYVSAWPVKLEKLLCCCASTCVGVVHTPSLTLSLKMYMLI